MATALRRHRLRFAIVGAAGFIAQRPNDFVQLRPRSWIGNAHDLLHPVQLALRANEQLDELLMLGRESGQAGKLEGAFYSGAAMDTSEFGNIIVKIFFNNFLILFKIINYEINFPQQTGH